MKSLEPGNTVVRKMLVERGIVPDNLPPTEDVKKEERKVDDSMLTRYACYLFKKRFLSSPIALVF